MSNRSLLQNRVDSMLRRGVTFSIMWLLGLGSALAIIQAIRARKIINQSNGEIVGMEKVWWCFIVGGLGVLFWGFIMIRVIINGMSD